MGGNSTLAHPALEGAWGPAGGRWLCARQIGPLDPMSGPSVSSGATLKTGPTSLPQGF